MYVRDRQDALDVLAEILELPERTQQLINLTVKIALCLNPEARNFLADCQATLIEGGLDNMRRQRREALAEADGDLIVVIDSDANELFEEVASARDALRVADIVREVFPEIADAQPAWVIARAVVRREQDMRECVRSAVIARGEKSDPKIRAQMLFQAAKLVQGAEPDWYHRADAMRNACLEVVRGAALSPDGRHDEEYAEFLFTCIALQDHRVELFADWIEEDPQSVVDFVGRLHQMAEAALEVESKVRERKSDSA